MTDFKIGDKVRRIGRHNGDNGACIGTTATVTKAYEDGFISVYYHGCYDDEDGSEIWATRLTDLFQEPRHKDEKESMNTKSLQDAYLAMQEASGIKVGDTVRVLRKAAAYEMGWGTGWVDGAMDSYIGREWQVTDVAGAEGVTLGGSWCFPFFVLEKTKDASRFIEINGHKAPEPERKALERGEEYWAPDMHYGGRGVQFRWYGTPFNNRHLSNGLVHKTREAAGIHAKALLSFTSKEED